LNGDLNEELMDGMFLDGFNIYGEAGDSLGCV
jgi:hypothetical protein